MMKRNWWTTGAAIGVGILATLVQLGIIPAEMAEHIQTILVVIGLGKARDGSIFHKQETK